MVEFKIQVDELVVETFGHEAIESHLHDFVKKMLLKAAAHDVLEDLQTIDLENDKAWQAARHLAWKQEKPRYRVDQ
jgi:hypothetical protein